MSEKTEVVQLTKTELTDLLNQAAEKATTDAKEAFEKSIGDSTTAARKFAQTYKGAYSGMSEDEQGKLETKEKMVSFIKAVYHKDASSLTLLKGMTEGTGSAGGFVVPEEFAAEVNRVVEDFGLVPKLARKFPMSTDTLNVPRLASSVTVYYPGEATAGTASQPVFEQVVLASKTLVGITPMSNELLADANISVVDLLVELFAEAIAGMLDSQGLTGTGTPFVGILNDTGVTVRNAGGSTTSGLDTFTEAATPAEARQLIATIKPWALQGAAFIMHRTVWALMQVVEPSSGAGYAISAANPVMIPNNALQGFPNAMAGTLWGYPVYLSDKMPTTTAVSTKFIIFGNLKHLYMGTRQEMGVTISQDATVAGVSLFETNQSAVRVVSRHALAVGLPTAFAVLKTAAS